MFRRSHSAAVRQAVRNVTNILGLDPETKEFTVVFGAVPANNKEIAMVTRSIFEVLLDIASTIVVPETHVTERRVCSTPEGDLGLHGTIAPLIKITSSSERPGDAFVAIPYRRTTGSRSTTAIRPPRTCSPSSCCCSPSWRPGARTSFPSCRYRQRDEPSGPPASSDAQAVRPEGHRSAGGRAGRWRRGAGPAAAQGRSIVIGYQEQPDWLLFAARDLGLFEKAGLSPTFVKFDAGPPMIEAIRSGRLDLASVGSVAFLIGLSQGVDWTMIGINPEGAYGQGLVVHKDSAIRTPTDLKGKRVGLFMGATAQFGFLMMLRQHGIRIEQVTVVHMAPEAQLHALETRQIDAAMVWEPWMHRMIRNANARIVETEGNLGIYTNVDCYSVRRDWLADQPRYGAALPAGAGGRERRHQQGSQDRLSCVGPRGRAQRMRRPRRSSTSSRRP